MASTTAKRRFMCPVPACGAGFTRAHGRKKHLIKQHTHLEPSTHYPECFPRAKLFPCPHPGCQRAFDLRATSLAHYTRRHCQGTPRRAATVHGMAGPVMTPLGQQWLCHCGFVSPSLDVVYGHGK